MHTFGVHMTTFGGHLRYVKCAHTRGEHNLGHFTRVLGEIVRQDVGQNWRNFIENEEK